jgi:Na+-transporting methylmalonyl-CoA/oxaloacetate decarboxylase gamma subunit
MKTTTVTRTTRRKRPIRWVEYQTKNRPFLSALVVLMIVIVPGFVRLENASNKTNQTAAQVEVVSQAQVAQVKAISLANCQTRNTAQKNGRQRFDQLFNAIEVILTSSPTATPEQQQAAHSFVESLRKAVPLDATVEDVDCNGDGQLTIADYG